MNLKIRFVALITLMTLLPLCSTAQEELVNVRRGDCTPGINDNENEDGNGPRRASRRLPAIRTNWDPNKTYKQMVVLFEFSDSVFHREDARAAYDRIFNEAGYNEGLGAGCVADYFRDQSGGLLNLSFDIYGPVTVSGKAQPYDNPTIDTRNYGRTQMEEATRKVLEAYPDADYSQYDWNGDGTIEQVIYVYAGPGGNKDTPKSYGHIWPNTSTMSQQTTPGGYRISNYTCSAELWLAGNKDLRSCGIGTICHEFSHSLGLPDIYPVGNNWTGSVADEWDLMDGGNFTNYGWCPPNYSPLEKMLLGWLQPVELTEAFSAKDMPSAADSRLVYQVKHTDNEYLLIENRQWKGWDLGLPGKGIVIWHVNYDASDWKNNRVNSTTNQPRYSLVAADNMNYDDWIAKAKAMGITMQNKLYRNSPRLNSILLSGSVYPFIPTEETEKTNNEFTDSSTPAAEMFTNNSSGSKLLGKPLTNIAITEDGLASFDFMGGATGIESIMDQFYFLSSQSVYDLSGRRVLKPVEGQLVIVRGADGIVRKVRYGREK